VSEKPWKDARPVSNKKRTAAIQNTLDQVEVSMHTTTGQYPGSRSSRCDSFIGIDEQRRDSRNELVVDCDLESGMKKSVL
jgi:hypothetical protein